MTSAAQDKEFIEATISRTLLEDSIAWLRKNVDIEELVGIRDLKEYVRGYTDLNDIIEFKALREWALANGFKEVEE
jgi:hypothetical protein